jgi:probable addiction module antidote protein
MVIKLKSYRSRLLEKLIIPSEAKHYINAALKDSPEMFLEAIKDVAQARQMARVAKKSGMAREALYRSLSRSGNPTYETLISVLKAVGLRIDRVECLPVATGNKPQKVKGTGRKFTHVLAPTGSGKTALLMQTMQAGFGERESQSHISRYTATNDFVAINAYANANAGSTAPTKVLDEQRLVLLTILFMRGNMADSSKPEAKPIPYKKTEEFSEYYANNALLESSLWDLKLIFGQLDQQTPGNVVVQYCSTTMPWAQAKVLHYFLGVHLAAHEVHNGRVQIPSGIIPPIPDKTMPDFESDPKGRETHDAFKALYDDFIAANPEAK